MAIHVVEGDAQMELLDCRSLARFELFKQISPMTRGAARIRVTFAVDADGLLTVSAEERTTGVAQRIEVKPSYGLSHEDMADMLDDSLENAEADADATVADGVAGRGQAQPARAGAALAKDGALLSTEERAEAHAGRARLDTAIADEDPRPDQRRRRGHRTASSSAALQPAHGSRHPRGVRPASSVRELEQDLDKLEQRCRS